MEVVLRRLLIAVVLLSALGLGISGYSLAHHGAFVSGSFCTFGDTFNCDTVNRGAFSDIAGIPIALVGVLGYLFLGATALLRIRFPHDRGLAKLLPALVLGGFIFTLYLTGIEAFVLRAWCLLCISSQITMLVIFILMVASIVFSRKKP